MLSHYKPVITNRSFVHLWISQIFSQLTIHIINFLLLVRLFLVTGSTIATSILWVAYALPAILIGPFASASIDMLERRRVLIITNLLQSLTILIFVFVHQANVFMLYGVVIAYSLLNQFYIPAEASSLPSLVGKKSYPHANSLFFLTQQSSLILGFGIAGILNQFLGFERSLLLCSLFIFIAFLSVLFLPKLPVKDKIPGRFEDAFFKFFKRIVEGYQFIKENHIILAPFVMLLVFYITSAIVIINVPVIAQNILLININSAGIYMIAPAGIGAAIGALIVPRLLKLKWRKKKIIEISLAIVTLSLFAIAIIPTNIHMNARIIISTICVVLAGIGFVGVFIPSQTLLQEKTPGGLRGRVFGNFWFLSTVATIFPVLFSGAVTEFFGIRILLVILALIPFGLAIFIRKFSQRILANGFRL